MSGRILIAAGFLLALSACTEQETTGEFYTRWDLAGGCRSGTGDARSNALGQTTAVCDSVGPSSWVWVTYAAGWCSSSRSQAAEIRRLSSTTRLPLSIFTVLTAGNEVFNDPQVSDAQTWSRTYGLPPENVLIEPASNRTLPQHLLLGPDGRTWYRYVGHLRVDEMLQLLDDFASGTRQPNLRDLPPL